MQPELEWKKQTFKTSDGIEIAYYIDDFSDPWQPAETLVMLHPAMSSSRRFYSMVPGLARRFRVIRVDTRGHGAFRRSAGESAGQQRTADEGRAGAARSPEACQNACDRCIGRRVFSAATRDSSSRPVKKSRAVLLDAGLQGRAGQSFPLDHAAKRGMRAVFGETINDRLPVGEADPKLIAWVLDEICKNDLAFLTRFIGYWTDTDFMDEIHAIKCPTLIVAPVRGADRRGVAIRRNDEAHQGRGTHYLRKRAT